MNNNNYPWLGQGRYKEKETTMSNSVSHENIDAFRKAYNECKGDTFMFEGQEMDKRYSMYLLEYWDMEEKKHKKQIGNN
jgi:hypothetical protein